MSEGFNQNKIKVNLNKDEIDKLIKKYKNIKKYMKTSFYQIKKMDGTEKIVNNLLEED